TAGQIDVKCHGRRLSGRRFNDRGADCGDAEPYRGGRSCADGDGREGDTWLLRACVGFKEGWIARNQIIERRGVRERQIRNAGGRSHGQSPAYKRSWKIRQRQRGIGEVRIGEVVSVLPGRIVKQALSSGRNSPSIGKF